MEYLLWICSKSYSIITEFNTLRPRQDGRHFPDIFKWIFVNENPWILIKISLTFVPRVPINNILVLVQIMAWRCPGDKPLSETMMVRLPTHICITQPQWVATCVQSTREKEKKIEFIVVTSHEYKGISNHQLLNCLLNSLFRLTKEIIITALHYWTFLRIINCWILLTNERLCEWYFSVMMMTSSWWWRHHDDDVVMESRYQNICSDMRCVW